ncbi:Uncharacterised protein [Candidatus Gugararchaeum adminiculabundum]|nr:Uncharacterised protein [Candidatus Gugararchaeum adminiculabundum]
MESSRGIRAMGVFFYISLLLVLAFLSLIVYHFLTFAPAQDLGGQWQPGLTSGTKSNSSPPPSAPACTEGAVENCTRESDSCPGTHSCYKGRWSGCAVPKICVPGNRVSCATQDETCSYGAKVCNPCGTGWGDCTLTN